MSDISIGDILRAPYGVVRPYRAGDGVMMASALNTSYHHLRGAMSWARPHVGVIQCERLVARLRRKFEAQSDFPMAILTPNQDALLGSCAFHPREGGDHAYLGLWLRASAAGHGLGTAVARDLLRWGFEVWRWRALFWRCHRNNTASARTAVKAGMQLDVQSAEHMLFVRRAEGNGCAGSPS